jgi:hypothetical protein
MDTQVAVGAEDVQVVAKPRRRMDTAEYKRRILKEAACARRPGRSAPAAREVVRLPPGRVAPGPAPGRVVQEALLDLPSASD